MVSEEFMASVYDQVEAYREAMERANASRHEWEDEQPTVPSLRAPKAVPFIKVALSLLSTHRARELPASPAALHSVVT